MARCCFLLILCYATFALTETIDIKINNKTILNEQPKLIASVPNGQKLLIGDINQPERNILYIANLKGSPYEMGQAYGQLFMEQLKDMISTFYMYIVDSLEKNMQTKMPKFIAHDLRGPSRFSIRTLLQLNVMITKKYTNKRYYEEINGISKGSGIPASELAKINIFPQLVKGACTVAGVWGKATQNGETIHMRSLDWDYRNPMSKYPIAVVYHPSNKTWHPHVNFAWIGLIGSLTGMSNKISLGQKVWIPPQGSVQTTRYGNPWTYVLRDVLYQAHDLQTALNILETTYRTCAINLGIGSVDDKSFRMLNYAEKTLDIYDDKNYTHYDQKNHPKIPGVAYFDKNIQPSNDSQVGEILKSNMYGHWEMESLWRILGMTHQTGDTQLTVFDLENQEVLIAYSQYNGTMKAFERRPIYLNMNLLFEDF